MADYDVTIRIKFSKECDTYKERERYDEKVRQVLRKIRGHNCLDTDIELNSKNEPLEVRGSFRFENSFDNRLKAEQFVKDVYALVDKACKEVDGTIWKIMDWNDSVIDQVYATRYDCRTERLVAA